MDIGRITFGPARHISTTDDTVRFRGNESAGWPSILAVEAPMPPCAEPKPATAAETPETIRETAYRLARQELPDSPVEDVLCRAEKIVAYLSGGAT